ncbi:MAG TPA: ABC transporter permease [Gemmatimonadaceae bacterium]|nr:ABC transporter permease [Gemmatimonadaceae bacterium]
MSLFQDLRYAVRLLLKDRWFTVIAAVVLALGIGANNAVFTIVNAVLLRSLPFPNSEQLVVLLTRDIRGRQSGVSLADFDDWRSASRTLSGMSLVFGGSFNVSDEGRIAERYAGSYVSANYFKMIGITPILGRDFSPEDDGPGGPPVVMLSNAVWQQRYGSDPNVLGTQIRLNGITATVIGVVRQGLGFPQQEQVWLPMSQLPPALRQQPRQARNYFGIGRLADGVTLEQGRAELNAIGGALASKYPDTNKELAPYPDSLQGLIVGPQIRLLFWTLLGAVGFVLLIACSNVANLLLARAARRTGEMSVRVAIGASRWQIVRQLLTESVLLAFVAGALGLLLSVAGIRWFDSELQNVGRPWWMVFTMDWRTFGFLFAICIVTGVLFGLAPALHVSRTNVNETLKEGGRSGSTGIRARRWANGLIVAQLALTLVLLAGAGFMMRSFFEMYTREIGIDTSRVLTMQLILPVRKYPTTESRSTFMERAEERLSAAPDIEAVSFATNLPGGGGGSRQIEFAGQPDVAENERPSVTLLSVGPRYFDAIGAPVLRGRAFNESDGLPGRESVIVNQRLVDMYFKGGNPLDGQIRFASTGPGQPASAWLTVVGVAPNVRQRIDNQSAEADPIVYIPHRQDPTLTSGMTLIARTRAGAAGTGQTLREAMRAVDPDQALFNLRTLDEVMGQQRFIYRVFGTMFSLFAGIALILAAVGLYAVTAYAVTQHTREIGVRVVLGAAPAQVIALFLRRGAVQLGIGLVIGVAGAFGVGRLLQALLVQTSPRDPLTLVSIVALLTIVAVVACIVPARRATRLDPLHALRHE